MRLIALAPLALVTIIACSSSGDDEPACPIVGTYTSIDKKKTGTCADVGDEPTTWTVTADGRGGYLVEIGGATGGCTATASGACKIQGKCDVRVAEPVDPARDQGTLQFSWTFAASGFSGSTIASNPPTKALTSGCSSEYTSTGSRR